MVRRISVLYLPTDKMPEADYGFKLAPTVRNCGGEVARAAQFQVIA
jgi:hypothetical protein